MNLVDGINILWGEKPVQPIENDDEEYLPHSIMTNNLPIIIDLPAKKKKEQLKKLHYNILIYQILPYPPHTKEPHNHSKLN